MWQYWIFIHFCLTRELDVTVYESESRSVVSDSLPPHELYNSRNYPGQNTGVSSLSLLQWIVPIQESNQGLRHCRWIVYQLSYQGSLPYITGGKAIWNIALAMTFSNSFLPTGTSYMSREQGELICKSLEKEVVALNIHISKIQVWTLKWLWQVLQS